MNLPGTDGLIDQFDRVEVQGKTVWVPHPTALPTFEVIDREDLISRALAAWLAPPGLSPLHFRLYGPPGSGKNMLIYRLAQVLGRDLYIINGHQELGPEDVACTATMTTAQAVEYVASPLFAAMLRGGICFFDEIAKAPTTALATLASVLDDRRSLTSVLAGIRIRAHPAFLFAAALNKDEEEGLGLPGFIDERTRPAIPVGYPGPDLLERILRARSPGAADAWYEVFLKDFGADLSPREAVTLLGYGYRLALRDAVTVTTPEEAHRYLQRAAREVGMDSARRESS